MERPVPTKQAKSNLQTDERGAAAIEFAFVASMLGFILMAVTDVGLLLYERSDMRGAMHAGAYYFVMGGTDNAEAETKVKAAWRTIPEGTTVSATDYCECGDVVSVCTSVCSDQSLPAVYHKISIQTKFNGLLLDTSYTVDETIRVR